MALICCITVVIIKYHKRHSGFFYNNQQVELDTIKVPFPDTTMSQIQDPCPHYEEANHYGKHPDFNTGMEIISIYDNFIIKSSITEVSYFILLNIANQEVSHDLPVGVRNPSNGNVPQGNESQDMET